MQRFFILISCCVVCCIVYFSRKKNRTAHHTPQFFKTGGYLFALICFLLASRQIPLGAQIHNAKGQGVDIMVMLDVSQSMQVTDMPGPMSRLQFAKQIISTLIQKEPQARWGIGIFAGEAQGVLPLTNDTNLVTTFLAGVDYQNLTKQGTRLDEALSLGSERFDTETPGGNILLILSDGGEEQITISEKTKKLVNDVDIDVYILGIGTETGGPITQGVDLFGNPVIKERQGAPVISKLDETALRNVSSQIKGTYLRGSKSTADHLASAIDQTPGKQVGEHGATEKRTATALFVVLGLLGVLFSLFAPLTAKYSKFMLNLLYSYFTTKK